MLKNCTYQSMSDTILNSFGKLIDRDDYIMEKKKSTSIFSVILTIIEIAIILLAICRFAFPSYFQDVRVPCAFVVSDSMQPVLTPGTFTTLKSYHEGDELKVGDIVTYLRYRDGKTIIHRVIELGDDYVITKGDNNSIADGKIEYAQIRGIVTHILRVDNEKAQSLVRNYFAKGNDGTRKTVNICIIALAAVLMVAASLPEKPKKKKGEAVEAVGNQAEGQTDVQDKREDN